MQFTTQLNTKQNKLARSWRTTITMNTCVIRRTHHFFAKFPRLMWAALLDVGCGVGRSWRLLGLLVGSAEESTSQKKPSKSAAQAAGLDMSCQTLDELREENVRFHAVTAFEVLEHVREPVELVKSAMALLHNGGWFFCTVPNRESPTVLKNAQARLASTSPLAILHSEGDAGIARAGRRS